MQYFSDQSSEENGSYCCWSHLEIVGSSNTLCSSSLLEDSDIARSVEPHILKNSIVVIPECHIVIASSPISAVVEGEECAAVIYWVDGA